MIDAAAPERIDQLFSASPILLGIHHAELSVAGVDFDLLTGFGVFERNDTNVRQIQLPRIGQIDANQIVAAIGQTQGPLEIGLVAGGGADPCRRIFGQEIAEKKDNRLAAHEAVEGLKGTGNVRSAVPGFEEQDLANDAKNVAATLLGRDEGLDLVGKEKQADFVVVAGGGERENARQLGGQFAFALIEGPEIPRSGEIDREDDGKLAFFFEELNKGPVHFGGDIPVDCADIVTGHVFPHFGKVHPCAFEDTVIGSDERIIDEPTAPDLDLSDLLEDLFGYLATLHDEL